MSLIQELGRYLNEKYDNKVGTLIAENDELENQIQDLKSQIQNLEINLAKVTQQKNSALDELGFQQSRVDALLRQLSEKNGGK